MHSKQEAYPLKTENMINSLLRGSIFLHYQYFMFQYDKKGANFDMNNLNVFGKSLGASVPSALLNLHIEVRKEK